MRLRQPGGRGVAVAAVLRHVLGQFALAFLHETVALGLRAGDLLGQFLLLAEIGVETGSGVDEVLARIDQFQFRGEILGDQLLVHVLRLARQPDLLLQALHLGLVRREVRLVLLGLALRGAELGGVFGLALAEDVALVSSSAVGLFGS